MTEQTRKYKERLKAYAGELEEQLSSVRENLAKTNKQFEDLQKRRDKGEAISSLYDIGQFRSMLMSQEERYRVEAERFYKFFPQLRPKS